MREIICFFTVSALFLSNLIFDKGVLLSENEKNYAETIYVKEDINRDGITGLTDIRGINSKLLKKEFYLSQHDKMRNKENAFEYDIDENGQTNVLDSIKVKKKALKEAIEETDMEKLKCKNNYSRYIQVDYSKEEQIFFINSYDELTLKLPKSKYYDYYEEGSIEDDYTSEFFKDNILIVYIPKPNDDENSFLKFSLENGILYIDNRVLPWIPLPSWKVNVYEISRDLLSKYKFEKVEYRDITKCGREKVSLDVFVPLKITSVDEWVDNVDGLNKLLNENDNVKFSKEDLDSIYREYSEEFFEKNKLLISSSSLNSPYIEDVKYDTDYLYIKITGFWNDDIRYSTLEGNKILFISVSKEMIFEEQNNTIIQNDNMIA